MTPEEVVSVVGVLAVAFDRKVDTQGVLYEAYEAALEDLEVEDPRALVVALLRTMEKWPSPAALRRAILNHFGADVPDEDQAWAMATQYVTAVSSGKDVVLADLPAPVQEAIRLVGSWSIKTEPRGVVFAQFRDVYRQAKARHDQQILEASWKKVALTRVGQLRLGHGDGRSLGPGRGDA